MRTNQEGILGGESESLSFISRLVEAHVSKHSCLSVLEQVTETPQKSPSVIDPDLKGLVLKDQVGEIWTRFWATLVSRLTVWAQIPISRYVY